MLKLFCKAFLLYAVVTSAVFANTADKQIRVYIDDHFTKDFLITDPQIGQLSWAFAHDNPTHDLDLRSNTPPQFIEISRALARLYCARLLRAGDQNAYNKFVAAQLSDQVAEPLTFASFTKLAQHVQSLSVLDYELLETAAILSAVSLSKPAADLAKHAMDQQFVTSDKMNFLAATLRKDPNIYPLTAQSLQDYNSAKKLLYVLFPPQTNFRHMLYTEGGVGMFKYLRTMIKHKFIDRAGLDLWYAHWIVNIAGFRGHVNQHGSLYLHEGVAQCMFVLQNLVYEMLEVPNFNPLIPYLEARASHLELNHLPVEDRLFIAHLASLMRIYEPKAAKALCTAIMQLPDQDLQLVRAYFLNGLHDPEQPTNTHVPALFANALEITSADLPAVINELIPVYNAALNQAVARNINSGLSFERLAASDQLNLLLIKRKLPLLNVSADGTVAVG